MKKAINSFFQLDALKKTMKRQYAWIFSLLILNYVKKGDSYTVYHTEPCTECSTKEAIDSFFLKVNRVVSYCLFTRQCYLKGALRKKQL